MVTERFCGTIQELCDIDISGITEWLRGFPQSQWYRFHDRMTDESRCAASQAVERLSVFFPDGAWRIVGLWHLAPYGGSQPPHIDEQPNSWLARVHAPIVTNDQVEFAVGGELHRMKAGKAYLLNTLLAHSVVNRGNEHRVHLVIDFGRS